MCEEKLNIHSRGKMLDIVKNVEHSKLTARLHKTAQLGLL